MKAIPDVSNASQTLNRLIAWSARFDHCCILCSNGYVSQNDFTGGETKDFLLAVGSRDVVTASYNGWNQLKVFYDKNAGEWMFGHFSYDLKNETEKLTSSHPDAIGFPHLHFFVPETVVELKGEQVVVHQSPLNPEILVEQIMKTPVPEAPEQKLTYQSRMARPEYLKKVAKILQHIKQGDVYELNFCQEFFAEEATIFPEQLFIKLNSFSPAPFAAFYKIKDKYLVSASPERFLTKRGDKIFSQPIKGTIRRGKNDKDDEQLKHLLYHDEKERGENIMIVDLVRNDLSKNCVPGTVRVEELCGIYSFPHVHQMISTVSGELKENVHPVDAIKDAFPMGSMTGAPKVRAMQLIEQYEKTKRGLYSGSVGYFSPDGDFDFNVVIRSIQYNKEKKYASVMAGSAITALSDPEKEYEECLLKARALMNVS